MIDPLLPSKLKSHIFQSRRKRIIEQLGCDTLVLFSAPVYTRNNDVEFPYRQDSDFYYLTGFEEPDSALVITKKNSNPQTILFLRDKDPAKEQWDGLRVGVEEAPQTFLVDEAYPIEELQKQLGAIIDGCDSVLYPIGKNSTWDKMILQAIGDVKSRLRQGAKPPQHISDACVLIHEMRLKKSEEEIKCMEQAIEISALAHIEAMKIARPDMYEFEVEAELLRCFRKFGSPRVAYDSIVGSGSNATVLHYRQNDRKMENGDLLLIDAGCEWGFYASDITRTFPINGKFSPEQRAIYEIVLEAQKNAISKIQPGRTLEDIHHEALQTICKGLISLNILSGTVEEVIENGAYKSYFMHKTSHWLGMDVHDVGSYKNGSNQPRQLEPGFILTVEPGIYITSPKEVDPKWHHIGIRIEDDVLVTKKDPLVLSKSVPKEIADIEFLMGTSITH